VSKAEDIFRKLRLTPRQLRAVAELRFADAVCLLEGGNNARATGAMYVGGFTIECLLKALLLERHPNLGKPVDPATLSASDREVLELLYSHELEAMVGFLPEVQTKLESLVNRQGKPVWHDFRTLCEEWTVYARYSPKLAKVEQARRFVDTIREVKEWLKEL
jgi:hypothetical protein